MKITKRILVIMLAIMMVFSICACSNSGEGNTSSGLENEESGASGKDANRKTMTVKSYDVSGETLKYIQIIEYDNDGKMLSDTYKDADGNISSETIYKWEDKENATIIINGTESGYLKYEYDDGDNVISEKTYDLNDVLFKEIEYKYENNILVKSEEISYFQGGSQCLVNEYNEVGKIIYYETAMYSNGDYEQPSNQLIIKYEYDEENNLIKMTKEDGYTHSQVTFEYEYDKNGQITKCIISDRTSNKEYDYEYDKAGNLTKYVDAQGTIIVAEYDKYGNIILKETYYGTNDKPLHVCEYEYY